MLFKVLPGCIDRSLRKVCTTPDILSIKPQLCAVLQFVLSSRFPEDRLAVVPQLCSSAAIVPNKRTFVLLFELQELKVVVIIFSAILNSSIVIISNGRHVGLHIKKSRFNHWIVFFQLFKILILIESELETNE